MLTRPPVPMLAQLETQLPTGEPWRYEPKLDGFRGLLWRRTSAIVQLFSRNGRDLGSHFPELVQAGQTLPPGTLIDGQIVMAGGDGGVDFGALQARLTMARAHQSRTTPEPPAVLVVFDILEFGGCSLLDEPLREHRRRLEQLLDGRHPYLQLIEQTAAADLAHDWLTLLPTIEGVVAKRADGRYAPGRRREWVNVKRYQTAECVVIGIAGDGSAPRLVLGLRHGDSEFHHLGVSRPLRREQFGPLATLVGQAGPEELPIPSRWQHDAVPPWRRLPAELVCEVQLTTIDLLVEYFGRFTASSRHDCHSHSSYLVVEPATTGCSPRQEAKLLHQPDAIGFLPQFRELATVEAPDVNRAKLERLPCGWVASQETTSVGPAIRQASHDRVTFCVYQLFDGRV